MAQLWPEPVFQDGTLILKMRDRGKSRHRAAISNALPREGVRCVRDISTANKRGPVRDRGKRPHRVWGIITDTLGSYWPPCRQLKELGVKTIELDFADEASVLAAAEKYGDRPLDILINCAGERSSWIINPKSRRLTGRL